MTGSIRLEGYAIVSANGMIADSDCLMPNSLKFEADQEFLESSLDKAELLVHGRKSHECQAASHLRKRLLMTRCVTTFELDPSAQNVWLWNPAGISFDNVCRELGVTEGVVAIIGGTAAYDMFLPFYAAFHMCRANKVALPGGVPVLSAVRDGHPPDRVLSGAGLKLAEEITLDPTHELRHQTWRRSVEVCEV